MKAFRLYTIALVILFSGCTSVTDSEISTDQNNETVAFMVLSTSDGAEAILANLSTAEKQEARIQSGEAIREIQDIASLSLSTDQKHRSFEGIIEQYGENPYIFTLEQIVSTYIVQDALQSNNVELVSFHTARLLRYENADADLLSKALHRLENVWDRAQWEDAAYTSIQAAKKLLEKRSGKRESSADRILRLTNAPVSQITAREQKDLRIETGILQLQDMLSSN